jgi:hypothetical protein
MEDRYIGDGVYASWDGWHIVLDLRAQDNTTKIALDPQVMEDLKRFEADCQKEKKEENNERTC